MVASFNRQEQLNATVQDTVLWLKKCGLPALPVAPAQDAELYPARNKDGSIKTDKDGNPLPAFTGKNPSYLDQKGIPHLINHSAYQKSLPSEREYKVWFANPLNGVGTLGGWNGITFIDLDAKHFESIEELENTVEDRLARFPVLADTWQEETHSGGYRIAVKCRNKPEFTNFCLTPNGGHVGEALGEGRFTVLAPTVGVSGNSYRCVRLAEPVEIESLESIEIYGVTKQEESRPKFDRPSFSQSIPGSIPLELLGTDESRRILNGDNIKGDRSASLTSAAREWYGWENWSSSNGINFKDSADSLIRWCGDKLGLDQGRVDRIIKTLKAEYCQPACVLKGGDESAWKKIRRLDKMTYLDKCPSAIKQQIDNNQFNSITETAKITPEAILSAPETEYKDGLNPLYLSQRMQTRDQIIYYLNKGYGASELAIFRDGLESQCIKQFDWDKKVFPKLWEDTYAEFYATDEKPEKKSLISDTLTIKNRRLNIAKVVNPVLANAIRNFYAQLVPEDPDAVAAAFLLSFLGTLGSFCTIGTELIYRKGTKGTAKPNLYVGSVGYSGTAKSLITDILKFALGQFQDKEDERFNSRYQQWVEDGSKGEEPQRRRFLLQDCTTEALAVIQSQQPTKGLTSIQDEFAKFFKDQGKYKSGKSGDLDALLELKAGDSSIQVDRKGGRTPQERYVRCKKTSFSLIGGIQPDVLKALMGDFSDQSGFWARFLWMMVPRRSMPFPIDPETGAVIDEGDQYGDLINAIMPILQWIDSLPAHQYHLTEASKTLFAHWHNHLDDLVMANDEAGKQGLCAFYSKCKRTTAELALLLHLVDMACKANESGQDVVTTEIGVATMESAIRLMDYVISQALYVQSWGNKNAGLTTEAVAVIEFSRKKGFVSASNLMSGKELFKKKNKYGEPLWNTEKIRDLLVDLADMGLGTLQGEGKSLKFGAHSENEKVEGNWYVFECSSISETQLNQWVTEFVSKFSDISNFHPVSSLLSSGKGAPVIKGGELGSEGSENRNTNTDRGKPIKKNPQKPNSAPQTVDSNGVEGFGAVEIDPKDSNDFGNWWAEVSSGESRQPAPVAVVEETEPGEEAVEASEVASECEFKVGDTVVYDWKGMTEEQRQENVRIFKQDESTGYVTEYLGKTGEVVSFDTARFSNGRTVFKVIVRFEDGCEIRCSLNELTKS